jgi:hypothetical protein
MSDTTRWEAPLLAGQPESGLLRTLFDISFDTFVTPQIVKVVYAVLTALIIVGTVVGTLTGFFGGGAPGAALLIPIFGFSLLLFFRMGLQTAIVFFRIADDIRALRP